MKKDRGQTLGSPGNDSSIDHYDAVELMASTYPLEARVLLDGAAVETLLHGAGDDASHEDHVPDDLMPGLPNQEPSEMEHILASIQRSGDLAADKHIVIVDSNIDQDHDLAKGLGENEVIFYLDAHTDVWKQIADIIDGQKNLAGLHLVTHGRSGVLALGNQDVDFSALTQSHRDRLAEWGHALRGDGDIFLYGCDFGAGEKGKQAVKTLARLTGADIAASDDITGALGDWELETTDGIVADISVFSAEAKESFQENLTATFDSSTLDEATVGAFFDGATSSDPALLLPANSSGYSISRSNGETANAGSAYTPGYDNNEIYIRDNADAFVLLSKGVYDLDLDRVTITFKMLRSINTRAAGVFGLVKPGTTIFNTPFGGAGEKEIGMIGNYIGDTQYLPGYSVYPDTIRQRHIASWATYLREGWDRSSGVERPVSYSVLNPITSGNSNNPGSTVILGSGSSSPGYNTRNAGKYDDQNLADLPEAYYSKEPDLFFSFMRVHLFKQDGSYYMRIMTATANGNTPPQDSAFRDVNEGYYQSRLDELDSQNNGRKNLYESSQGASQPGINLDSHMTDGKFKFFLALGSRSARDHDISINHISVEVDPANYSPEFLNNNGLVAQGGVDTTQTVPTRNSDGTAVSVLLAGKVQDRNLNPNMGLGIVLTGFASGYDPAKHSVYVGTEGGNAITWREVHASDFMNDGVFILKANDRIHIVTTDTTSILQTVDVDIINIRVWDGFKYSAGATSLDIDNLPEKNSAFSISGPGSAGMDGTSVLKVRFAASQDKASISKGYYVARFDENDPNDDVTLTDTLFGISDLGMAPAASYDFDYVIVFDQAVRKRAGATGVFSISGPTGLTGTLDISGGNNFQTTWTFGVSVQHGVQGMMDLSLSNADFFETAQGAELTTNFLPDPSRKIDVNPPAATLDITTQSLTENQNFVPVMISGPQGENIVHHVVGVGGPAVDQNKDPANVFAIRNNELVFENGVTDFELIFRPAADGAEEVATITIRSTDEANNFTDTNFTLTLVNVNENTGPVQESIKTLVLGEDQVGGQVITFSDLDLSDLDENQIKSTAETAFRSTSFFLVSSDPTGGNIVRYENNQVVETYRLNSFIDRDTFIKGFVRFIPDQNYFTLPGAPDSLRFRVWDAEDQSSADLELLFQIDGVNDIPTTTGNSQIDVVRGNDYSFSQEDFESFFRDVEDGNTPSSIIIVGITNIPQNAQDAGTISFGNNPLLIGDVVADVSRLVFSTGAASNGQKTLVFYGVDSENRGDALTRATITLNITNDPNPPQVGDVTLTATEDTPFTGFPVSEAGFTYNDVDNDDLRAIRFETLPTDRGDKSAAGQLFLGNRQLNQGDTVDVADLANLTLSLNQDYTGQVTMDYVAVNDRESSSDTRSFLIHVLDSDDPITAGSSTVTINEDTAYTFALDNFNYSDPDDPLGIQMNVNFRSLPSADQGQLVLYMSAGGQRTMALVSVTTIISAEDIRKGNVVFIPARDHTDRVNLAVVYSNTGAADSTQQVLSIEIVPEPDLPTSANNTITLIEDHAGSPAGYPFKFDVQNLDDPRATDFIFLDPDTGDSFYKLNILSLPDPTIGTLYIGTTAIMTARDMEQTDIANMTFKLVANATGVTSIEFRVENATGEKSVDRYTLAIEVLSVDDEPVIRNAPAISVVQRGTTTYNDGQFTFDYIDYDGEFISDIRLSETALTGTGTFYVGAGSTQNDIAGNILTPQELGRLEFRPDAIYAGTFNIIVNVRSGTLWSEDKELRIDVGDVEDPPLGKDQTFQLDEDREYTFSINPQTTTAADNNFYYYDPDPGDTFGGIRADILPVQAGGQLQLNGVGVTVGQMISVNDLGSLSFVPVEHASGTWKFVFSVFTDTNVADPTRFSTQRNTVTLVVNPIDDAPTSEDITIQSGEDMPIEYGRPSPGNARISFAFSDIDGDSLHSIRFDRSLNSISSGTFMFGTQVLTDSFILQSELQSGTLSFVPSQDFSGDITFTFQVASRLSPTDTTMNGISTERYELRLTIGAIDDRPETRDRTVTIREDNQFSFRFNEQTPTDTSASNDFFYFDPEGADLRGINIRSVPSGALGHLLDRNGNSVTSDQLILKSDINSLSFVPRLNAFGSAEFTFQVVDINGSATSASRDARFRIIVEPVNDRPTLGAGVAQAVTIQTQEKMGVTYGEGGFNFPYHDPEDELNINDGNDFDRVVFEFDIPTSVGHFLNDIGTPITNRTLLADDLDRLTFQPHDQFADTRSYTFRLFNRDGQSSELYTLTIAVGDVDNKPESEDRRQTFDEDTPYLFKVNAANPGDQNADNNDFIFRNTGNDNEQFAGVRIVQVPDRGQLSLQGRGQVVAGQLIARQFISTLEYNPPGDFNGTVTFRFQVYDDGDDRNASKYSEIHSYTLDVQSVDDVPEIRNQNRLTFALVEGRTMTYGQGDFQFEYYDPENDPLRSITIETSPIGAGAFYFTSNLRTAVTEIPFARLSELVFIAGDGRHVGSKFGLVFVNDNGRTGQINFVVNVGEIDDPPTADHITLTTTEAAASSGNYLFGAGFSTRLSSVYQDPEGVALSKVVFKSVFGPDVGAIMLSGVTVTAGQTVNAGSLGNLNLVYSPTFEPGKGVSALEHLTFQVVNTQNSRLENGIALADDQVSTQTYTLAIQIDTIDDVPTSANFSVTVQEDTVIRYGSGTFKFGYNDPDDQGINNLLVKFENLPGIMVGQLYTEDASGLVHVLTQGEQLSNRHLRSLRFVGAQDYVGDYTFSFTISNLTQISTVTYTGVFVVEGRDDRPESIDNIRTIDEGAVYDFTFAQVGRSVPTPDLTADFVFIDPDGNDFFGIRISDTGALNGLGTLMVGTTTIDATNRVITKDDFDNNLFSFVADPFNEENVTFSFIVLSDRTTINTSNEHQFVFEVNALPNRPVVDDVRFTINEDQALNIAASDFAIREPDSTDTETIFAFNSVPLSTQGHLVYGTTTLAAYDRVTVGSGGNFQAALSFIPRPNFNTPAGADPVEVEFVVQTGDGVMSEDSETASLVIEISPADDRVEARDIVIDANEGDTISFTGNDFLREDGQPNDPDVGEDLDYVRLLKVPSDTFGSFVLVNPAPAMGAVAQDDVMLTSGSTIDKADLDRLRFIPAPDYDQEITATYDVVNTLGQESARPYLITIRLMARDDNPTVFSEPSVQIDAGLVYVIDPTEFTSIFRDVDSGDSMKGIFITDIPSPTIGSLLLGTETVTRGQTILVDELEGLTFVPIGVDPDTEPTAGRGDFSFSLLDQNDNQSPVTTFMVGVLTDQNIPITSGRNLYLPANATLTFSQQQFPYSDDDDDAFVSVNFQNRLDRGFFYLDVPASGDADASQTRIDAGSLVAVDQLNMLRFHLDDGQNDYSSGSIEVIFRVFNDRNAASESQTITINITDSTNLPPEPINSPGEHLPGKPFFQIDRDVSYNLQNNLVNIFTDPEGDSLTILSVDGLAGTGLSFNEKTGVIRGSPTLVAAGRYTLKVRVSDSFGGEAEQTMDLIISNLLLTLPGNDQNTFQSTLAQIYSADTDNALNHAFAEELYLSEILDQLDNVEFYRQGNDVSSQILEQLAANSRVNINGLTVKIALGEDFALFALNLANDSKNIFDRPFTLAIKLNDVSGLSEIGDENVPTGRTSIFRASGDNEGARATDNSYFWSTSSQKSRVNQLNSGNALDLLTSNNSDQYYVGAVSSASAYGSSLPSLLRPSSRQSDSVNSGRLGDIHRVRTSIPNTPYQGGVYAISHIGGQVRPLNAFDSYAKFRNRLIRLSISDIDGENSNIFVVANSGDASGEVPVSGSRAREHFFIRTENEFFTKRPIDRLVTSALQRQAGDLYTSPLPGPDQSGLNIWSFLRRGDLPVGQAARGLVPSLYDSVPVPQQPFSLRQPPEPELQNSVTAPGNRLQQTDPNALRENDVRQQQGARVPNRGSDPGQEVTLPTGEALERIPTDQREEFVTRLLELLRNQGQNQGEAPRTPEALESPTDDVDQERIRELELLNRLIRGR